MRLFLLLIAAALTFGPAHGQQIYKHVAPDGTIVYSDQPSTVNAKPMGDLPELTIVQAPKPKQKTIADLLAERASQQQGENDEALAALYEDFELVEPTADQILRNTGGAVLARAQTDSPLQPGLAVRFLMDGTSRGDSQTFSMLLSDVVRGEHQLQAQIVTENGDVLASDSVTFHVKQTSIQHKKPTVTPIPSIQRVPRNPPPNGS